MKSKKQKYLKLFISTFKLSACTFGGGFVIISIISIFYQQFRDNAIVNMALTGMLAGVAAVICDVAINMIQDIFKRKRWLPVLVFFVSFVAVHFFHVNIMLIILVCGIIGAIATRGGAKKA